MMRRSWPGARALNLSLPAMPFAQPAGRAWRVGAPPNTIRFERLRLRTAIRDVGLVTYGPDIAAMARRNAAMLDRILKGTRLAGIPVEEPPEFELVVNLKTAAELGIKVPDAMLLRANQVIR